MQSAMSLPMTLPAPMSAGSIEAYIQVANRVPMLSAERERELALRLREHLDVDRELLENLARKTGVAIQSMEPQATPQHPRYRETKVELGYVEAAAGKLLLLGGGPGVRRAAFEIGPRRLTVSDGEGTKTVTVNVKLGATVVAQ